MHCAGRAANSAVTFQTKTELAEKQTARSVYRAMVVERSAALAVKET